MIPPGFNSSTGAKQRGNIVVAHTTSPVLERAKRHILIEMAFRTVLIITLAALHGSSAIAIPSHSGPSAPTCQKPLSFIPSSSLDGPNIPEGRIRGRNGRPLKGRFLHVTDIVSVGAIFVLTLSMVLNLHELSSRLTLLTMAPFFLSTYGNCLILSIQTSFISQNQIYQWDAITSPRSQRKLIEQDIGVRPCREY